MFTDADRGGREGGHGQGIHSKASAARCRRTGNYCAVGELTKNSIAAMKKLAAAVPGTLGGTYRLHSMLWHQVREA